MRKPTIMSVPTICGWPVDTGGMMRRCRTPSADGAKGSNDDSHEKVDLFVSFRLRDLDSPSLILAARHCDRDA